MFPIAPRIRHTLSALACALLLPLAATPPAHAAINVLTVDCTPLVSPGFTSFGPGLTIGMALQFVDPGNVLFNVTEVDPPTFRLLTAAQLQTYDLIAVNNRRDRINDNCLVGSAGLGAVWQSAVGATAGGRVVLTSHDAPRFHLIVAPNSTAMSGVCPGCEPFGAYNLVRDAALWAGNGCTTGLLIFNDAVPFDPTGVGLGWSNPELNFPGIWGIADDADPSGIADGGHTDILPAFTAHPIYQNVTDARLVPNSISSFAANVGDNSFHGTFLSYNEGIFTKTEEMVNSGVVDVGATGCCSLNPLTRPNGSAITLIRDDNCATPTIRSTWGSMKTMYR